MAFFYDICDILKIESDFALSRAWNFSPALDCFQKKDRPKKPDLIVKIDSFSKRKIKGYREVAFGIFYSQEQASIVSNLKVFGLDIYWQIRGLSEKTTHLSVSYSYLWLSRLFLSMPVSSVYPLFLLIRNILQMKLLAKKASFLIGSAISHNGKGIIFTGTTGSGKTTTLLSCMKHLSVKYMANDIMILYRGLIHGLLTNIAHRRVNFSLLSHHQYIDPRTHYSGRIVQSVSSDCDFYFLERSPQKDMNQISCHEGMDRLMAVNNRMHSYFNERSLSFLPYLSHDFTLLETQKKFYEILKGQLSGASFFKLSAPSCFDNMSLIKNVYSL